MDLTGGKKKKTSKMKNQSKSKNNQKYKTKKNLSRNLKTAESSDDDDPTLHADVNNFLKKMDFSQFAHLMSEPQNEFRAMPSSGKNKGNKTRQDPDNKRPTFTEGKRGPKIFQSSDINKSSKTHKLNNQKLNSSKNEIQKKGKRGRLQNFQSSDTKKNTQTPKELDSVKAAFPTSPVKGKREEKMLDARQANIPNTKHKPNKEATNTFNPKSKILQDINHKNTTATSHKKVIPLNAVKRNNVPDSNSNQNKKCSMTLKRKSLSDCSPSPKKKSPFHPSELKSILNSPITGTRNQNSNVTISKAKPRVHVLKRKDSKINDKREGNKVNTPISSNPVALMKEKLQSQLESASFRLLNEKLYTSSGEEGLQLFRDDPKAFEIYQKGYANQVAQWPVKPLSIIISWLQKKPAKWIVGDFGCGEGTLAKSIKQKTYSIDIKACSPDIIECDMAHTPLESKSLNVVVFCLSLMGTNLTQFIVEANRVLVDRGVLKIVDVESRFTKLKHFLSGLQKLGFKFSTKDQKRYFWIFDFHKVKDVSSEKKVDLHLSPCLYKKR